MRALAFGHRHLTPLWRQWFAAGPVWKEQRKSVGKPLLSENRHVLIIHLLVEDT
jgi:hypothetical protein